MKVAYVHFVPPDGAALRHVEEFTRAARGLGHSVDQYPMNEVAARKPHEAPNASRSSRIKGILKGPFRRYLHEPKELLLNLPFAWRELGFLNRRRPDVLLVRDHVLEASCLFVARRLGLPLVLEVNAPAVESRLYFHQYSHLPVVPEWLEKTKLQMADAVIVVSSGLRDYFLDRYRVGAQKLLVNPNGADIETFHPAVPPDSEISARLRGGPTVGFVGSFQTWRGSDLLAELIRALGAARGDVRFLLVGDGPDLEGLLASVAPLGDRVLATGWVDRQRIPGLVSCIDVALLPESNFYSSPLKVVEWMAAGKAIVAPDYLALRDLISNGVDGLLFPPRDAKVLLETVLGLIEQPALRRRLGDAAAARVAASLTWKHNAQRVMSVCEGVSGDHPERATRVQDVRP